MPISTLDAHRAENIHDQLFVKVFAASQLTITSRWDTRHVRSGYWRLYHNENDGAGLLLADATVFKLYAGKVYLVPAGVLFSCMNYRRIRHLFIHFDLIGLTAVTVQDLFQKPLALASGESILRLVRELADDIDSPTTVYRAKALVYGALAELFGGLSPAAAARYDQRRLAQGPVAPALRRIESRLGSVVTNAELAALCHLCEDHFVRVFRKAVGRPPAQYILERRIAAATHQLAFGNDSIDQLADQLGFANRFHFTRMFTRRMGCGPAAYRRQTRV